MSAACAPPLTFSAPRLPAELPHCAAWPPERSSHAGTGSLLSTTAQSKIEALAAHWLEPMRATQLLSMPYGQHYGIRDPTIPADPTIGHEGCLGCTGWARAIDVAVRGCRIFLRVGEENAMFPYISTEGCGREVCATLVALVTWGVG